MGDTGIIRHGHARRIGGTKSSPTYHSWQAMHVRCRVPGRQNADRYFNKGIRVCDRWEKFYNFLEDMGLRPDGTTLDRVDSDRDYEPGNCRWATPREQARNTRRSKLTLETATDVAFRRLSGESCQSIAKAFSISESLPREIVRGRCWPDALELAKRRVAARSGGGG